MGVETGEERWMLEWKICREEKLERIETCEETLGRREIEER